MRHRAWHGRIVGIGRFRNAEARDAYLTVYDRAMAAWPATPTARHVPTRFGSTYVQSLGPSTGSRIVLLHAIAVASPLWYAAIGLLAEHHSIYAIDTITDAGRSAQVTSVGDGGDMALWLDEVLAAVELERVHLVGLSYGGWLALNQARRAPGRLASVTAIDPPNAIGAARMQPMLAMIPDALRAKFAKSDPALRRLLARLNNGTLPPEPVLDLAIAGLRTYKSKAPRPKRMSDDEFRSITTPTLLLLCEASPVNNARQAAARANLLPNVEIDVIAGAGHMLPVDQAEDFTTRLLAFVDTVDRAAEGTSSA
jgi:pimeloyl-ACP methyl ester carboxylesterase